MSGKTVTVIGGDLRQLTVAKELITAGCSVKLFLWEENFSSGISVCADVNEATGADILIFAMPMCIGTKINAPFSECEIDVTDILERLSTKTIVFGGKIPEGVKSILNKKKINYWDYLEREELALKNAVATAEGALEIAIRETPITIHNSDCVVVGYGRIGKILSRTLKSMGAKVTVLARRIQVRAEAEIDGFAAKNISELSGVAVDSDIIFNTVPSLLFNSEVLDNINNKTLLIDLASKPGGVDFKVAKNNGINVIWALSIPGKTAPVTAGEIIYETICNILHEMEG